MDLTRRFFALGSPVFLAGCVSYRGPRPDANGFSDAYYEKIYAEIDTEPFPVPAIDLTEIDRRYLRRIVRYRTFEQPGTVVVNPYSRYLYLVQDDGMAIRYGVGVGKTEAFNFQGVATISRKAVWPHWTPTADMIRRQPERYGPYRNGMNGGVNNPLGARALYLYRDGRDSFFRLHGTIEPDSIGTEVSSGCIRLLNQDIIDLYNRVPLGSKVVVLTSSDIVS
jgi:lipoprotein-anchoring transpeptidase ErfK/SrfK